MRTDLDRKLLGMIWKYSIMPTLEEYFYRKPERLRNYQLETFLDELGKGV